MQGDISIIEKYRESYKQPFVVEAEPLNATEGSNWDVRLIPEMGGLALQLFTRRVYLDGEQLDPGVHGEGWTGEPSVDRVTYITGMYGSESFIVELTEKPLKDPFAFDQFNEHSGDVQELYNQIEG